MIRVAIILFTVSFLLTSQSIYASNPPIQIGPTNNSLVSSSKLTWETPAYSLYSTDPYRIQVDDDVTFSSVYRDYKTKNTYYTPVLSDGVWYWRIKAKDSTGTWSEWSAIWSFTLTTSISTPTPSPISTPSTNPVSSPSPSPTPSPTPQPISSFTISNLPSQINSDQSFDVSINLVLPNNPNTNFYLKGAFRHPDKPNNYFGLTKVSENWIKNSSAYANQYKITTDASGTWSGSIEVKPDQEDSGFTGSGNYIFKAGKYNSQEANASVSWSNESTIKIIAQETANDQGGAQINTSSPLAVPSNSPSLIKANAQIKTAAPNQQKKYDKLVYNIASVAGVTSSFSTPSATVLVNQKQASPIVWVGLVFIFAGASSIGYIYLKKNAKIPF